MIQSMFSFKSIEEVTESCEGEGLRWMQIQPMNDRPVLADIIQRAEKANYKAIVVTCDHPKLALFYKIMRVWPPSPSPSDTKKDYSGNFSKELNDLLYSDLSALRKALEEHVINPGTWEIVDWIRSVTSLPIVLKGILHPDDAREAIKHDIQAIQVSNHGGRNIDETPPTVSSYASSNTCIIHYLSLSLSLCSYMPCLRLLKQSMERLRFMLMVGYVRVLMY